MEKLEPILKQKFWILLGVGLIVTVVGWWMAAGSLAATIAARTETLNKVEGSIPSAPMPNDSWTQQLSAINVRQQAKVNEARLEMWNRQKAKMFWPANVDKYAEKLPYQGEFNIVAAELYRENYAYDVERTWKLVRPIDQRDGTGIVWFPYQAFPKQLPGQLAPTSKQMWERHEDLWLLEPIMQAIYAVNGGENATRADASIHVINRLELMGGDRSRMPGAAGAGGAPTSSFGGGAGESEAGGYDNDSAGYDPGAMLGMGGGFGFGGQQAAAGPPSSADFDPKEVYGDGGSLGGGFGGYGGFGGGGSDSETASADYAADDTASSATGNFSAAPAIRRYVDDTEGQPFKTRAFYLSVIMDHRKLPDLIGALTANGDSAWPIEIGKVQVVRLNPDDGAATGGIGSLAMSGGTAYGGSGYDSNYSEGAISPFNTGSTYGSEPEDTAAYDPTAVAGAYPGGTGGYPGATGYPGGGMGVGGRPGGGLDVTLADPSLAKVALCGLIYIYQPVTEPPPAETPAAETPATATATEAAGTATEPTTPAEPTEPPATPAPADAPAEAPADPAAPQPPAAEPAAAEPAATESPPDNPAAAPPASP